MIAELDDTELARLRHDLETWSETPCYSDRFRAKCDRVAALIADHLAGHGGDAACARGVEIIFNTMAEREATRLERVGILDDQLAEAVKAGDARAWARAFAKMVRVLSEEHIRALMQVIAALAESDEDALEYPEEPRRFLVDERGQSWPCH